MLLENHAGIKQRSAFDRKLFNKIHRTVMVTDGLRL